MLSVGETKASFIPVCKPTDGLLAVTYSSRLAHRSEFGLQHFQFRKTKKLANNAISQIFGFSQLNSIMMYKLGKFTLPDINGQLKRLHIITSPRNYFG
jgi:hypothetical protein